MRVTGWSNGSPDNRTGAGYGLRMNMVDRDTYFKESWKNVVIELDSGTEIQVKLSKSFWKSCTELRSAGIGKWMIENKLVPWIKGVPPILSLRSIGERRFKLSK